MRSFPRTLLTVIAMAAFLFTLTSCGSDNKFAAIIDQSAPGIVAQAGINGDAIKLSELKGKVVLVDFWAVWCPPCVASFPQLQKWHETYHDQGFEILGVTMYSRNWDFDKKTGKLIKVGGTIIDPETGRPRTVGELEQPQENQMIKDFVDYHNLKHRIITVSDFHWNMLNNSYLFTGIPTTALIDRQGVVRQVHTGVNEAILKDLDEGIKKLVAQK